jgi:hypothetical protein
LLFGDPHRQLVVMILTGGQGVARAAVIPSQRLIYATREIKKTDERGMNSKIRGGRGKQG